MSECIKSQPSDDVITVNVSLVAIYNWKLWIPLFDFSPLWLQGNDAITIDRIIPLRRLISSLPFSPLHPNLPWLPSLLCSFHLWLHSLVSFLPWLPSFIPYNPIFPSYLPYFVSYFSFLPALLGCSRRINENDLQYSGSNEQHKLSNGDARVTFVARLYDDQSENDLVEKMADPILILDLWNCKLDSILSKI